MKVLGICGGNGVILHRFKKHLIGNIEIRSIFHTKDNEQWKANFGNIEYVRKKDNIFRQIDRGDINNLDIVIGAPDCGHSSILALSRAKSFSNPKNNESLNLFIACVKSFSPKVFLMENLDKLLEQYTYSDLRVVLSQYNIHFKTVSVSEFGNSQLNRIRLLIIGIRKDFDYGLSNEVRDQFLKIYKVSKLKTSSELTSGLEEEDYKTGNIREPLSDIITIYSGAKLSLQDIKLYWERNPDKKRFVVTDRKFTTAPGVYRNLPNEYPATARKANRQYNHLGLQLTPRELARIQGIPDYFKIYIDPKNPKYWINKSRATVTKTPPYEIGDWFFRQCRDLFNS